MANIGDYVNAQVIRTISGDDPSAPGYARIGVLVKNNGNETIEIQSKELNSSRPGNRYLCQSDATVIPDKDLAWAREFVENTRRVLGV